MPTSEQLDTLAKELVVLMQAGQEIYAEARSYDQPYAGWGESLLKKVRQWLDTAVKVELRRFMPKMSLFRQAFLWASR